MKHILFVCYVCIALASSAKSTQREYPYIYSACREVSIDRIKTDSKKTSITFTVRGHEGKPFYLFPNCRIIDSKLNVHPILSLKNANYGRNTIGKKKKVKIQMTFSPLASEDSIFDIVMGHTDNDFFKFYGVQTHAGKIHIPDVQPCKSTEPEFSATSMRKVCVIGHVESPRKTGEQLTMRTLDLQNERLCKVDTARIDHSGYFTIETMIHGPELSVLRFDGARIPVYLVPDDTILCNISHLREAEQTCDYRSSKGEDIHVPLLKAWPNGPVCDSIRKTLTNPEVEYPKFCNAIDSIKSNVSDFYKYLAFRYGLSSDEHELLWIDFLGMIEDIRMRQPLVMDKALLLKYLPEIANSPLRMVCPHTKLIILDQRLFHYLGKDLDIVPGHWRYKEKTFTTFTKPLNEDE